MRSGVWKRKKASTGYTSDTLRGHPASLRLLVYATVALIAAVRQLVTVHVIRTDLCVWQKKMQIDV